MQNKRRSAVERAILVIHPPGSTRAVRYECGVVPLPIVEEGITCGALILLDLIDLELPRTSPGAGNSSDSDSDDDSMLGAAHGPGRLQLFGCEDRPESLWAVHESGCWSLSLPWLPTLSKALAESSHRQEGNKGPRRDLDAALSSVPPPMLREVFRTSAAPTVVSGAPRIAASGPMHDMFLGDSLLVALQTPKASSATFCCFMQRQDALVVIPSSREGGVGSASSDPGTSASSGSPAGGGWKAIIDANLKAIYADLLVFQAPTLPNSKALVLFSHPKVNQVESNEHFSS